MQDFIAEGMKRYGEAALVMVKFGKSIESQLKEILNNRNKWGKLIPSDGAKAKSTTYWSEYPLLNARRNFKLVDKDVILTIAINWYNTKNNNPVYCVWFEPRDLFANNLSNKSFEPNDNLSIANSELRFNPDLEDFNLERDFNRLLDVFLGITFE